MRDYIDEIKELALFRGISQNDLYPMMDCLGCHDAKYHRGEFISLTSDLIKRVGLVLSGSVDMIKEDLWGDKTILSLIMPGELFGEISVCGGPMTSTMAFLAAEDTRVLFLPLHKVLNSCTMSCVFHHRLVENMVVEMAAKNMRLMEKVEITSKKTLRDKIMAFLSQQAQIKGSKYFEIPMKRADLADYLCADRSALSRELCNMKTDGLIDFEKNMFRLLK